MMLPLLIPPVRHVRARTFARRRAWAIFLFVSSYAAIWMVAGLGFLAVALAVHTVAPTSLLPLAFLMLVTAIWQMSPAKQHCLNSGHVHPPLAAFDTEALRRRPWALVHRFVLGPDAPAYFVSRGHLGVMAGVTLWLVAEGLERATAPRWGWRGPGKGMRIVGAWALHVVGRVGSRRLA